MWKRSSVRIGLTLALLAGLLLIYLFVLWPWMMRWGATDAEISMALPGDEITPQIAYQSTRAITINAPVAQVWPWLVQLGQDRAGFYSEDWLENLFLADIHNADEIQAEWQQLAQGGLVRGAPADAYGGIAGPDPGWVVPLLEPERVLYLWGPMVLQPVGADSTRLILRSPTAPLAPTALLMGKLLYDPSHFVMERGLMLGVKARAEGRANLPFWLQWPVLLGWLLAGLGMLRLIVQQPRGRWWLPLPLALFALVIWFTGDWRAATAGFLILGVPIAGFTLYGGQWWYGLSIFTAAVLLILLLAAQPFVAFGLIFLVIGLILFGIAAKRTLKEQGTLPSDRIALPG
ncbi:MAG: hypothetical protein KF893_00805 [Caldilineaceae bacterium]|nr:hypothetical protein [Caldilineaceae bacterium]